MKSGDRVSFDSGGSRLAAHLFLPDSFDPEKSYPAVVVVRPATGVKEQTAGLYAARLATHGFVTLAFDPRGFGGSDGRPLLEDPRRIIEDTRSGVTFVEGLGFVNPRHLFLAGVCMGGAYAPSAASEDDRIRAVASITPYLTLHLDYPARFGGRAITLAMATLTDVVVRAAAALDVDLYWYAVPPTRFLAALPFTLDISRGMRGYYLPGQPGHRPTWRNRINMASQLPLLRYDPFEVTRTLHKPFYMAYGTRGYSPDLLRRFFEDVRTPAGDKQRRVMDATHFEMYWQPRFVDLIANDVGAFFSRYLG